MDDDLRIDGALAAALNAVSNSARTPVTADLVFAALRGEGAGATVRALFGDCSLVVLDRLARGAGMSPADLRAAYRLAKQQHHAFNLELEDLIAFPH